jgi:hypothetical protein
MLVQIFSYVVVVEVGVWKTGGASPGCGLEVRTNCGQGRVTAAWTTTGPELDGLRCQRMPFCKREKVYNARRYAKKIHNATRVLQCQFLVSNFSARNITGSVGRVRLVRLRIHILIRSRRPLFFSSSRNHRSLSRLSARCSSFTCSSLAIHRSPFTCSSIAAHGFVSSSTTCSPTCPITMALQEGDRFADFRAFKTAMQDWGLKGR